KGADQQRRRCVAVGPGPVRFNTQQPGRCNLPIVAGVDASEAAAAVQAEDIGQPIKRVGRWKRITATVATTPSAPTTDADIESSPAVDRMRWRVIGPRLDRKVRRHR